MGDVHKFRRPPKNKQQFRGYVPSSAARKPGAGQRRPLAPWKRSVIAWAILIALATGLVAFRSLV